MSDRELLEAAARAAGFKDVGYGELSGGAPVLYVPGAGVWDPLGDDGEALRLAVKLRIKSRYHAVLGQGLAWTEGDFIERAANIEECGRDECAALRRAIVRAAAALATEKARHG